jgi:iron complex outermembrane recepter protein
MEAGGLARRSTNGRAAVIFVISLAMAAGIRPGVAATDTGRQVQFDIAPQPLPSALLKFSAQSGVQVTSPGELVEGKSSAGAVGTFNPSHALTLLLKDTSLHFDVVDATTVVISGSDAPRSPRNEFQRVNNPDNRPVAMAETAEIKLAQAATVAQTGSTPAPINTTKVDEEEVIVTGTSIQRADAKTALPVQVLKREDIARTGATSVEELFRQISAADSAGNTGAAQGSGAVTGGLSTISLRGLTSARTLVLINGRRSPVYGGAAGLAGGSSVDISAIPVAAIERVEILKDGASAIYGSDAIAGVVNFILREDYQGAEIDAHAGTPTRGGGATEETVSAFGGLGDLKTDRYNVTLGLNFAHVNALMGASRPFATRYNPAYGNDVTSSFAFPANVAIPGKGGGTRNPNTPNCGPDSLYDTNFPAQCRFDNSSFNSLDPEQRKLGVNFSGSLQVTDDARFYSEASFSQVKTVTTVQPVPLAYLNPLLPADPYVAYLNNLLATRYPTYHNPAVPGTGAFLLPPTSPYYPTAFATANGVNGQPLNVIYRDFANGPRLTEDTANTTRVVGGFKGTAAGWNFDTSLLYGEVRVGDNLESGYPLFSKIMPLLDGGTINPFGPTTDPAALAAAQSTEFIGQDFSTRTSITSLAASGNRELLTLPGGPLMAALGAEYRRETFAYDPVAALQIGDIAGQGGNELPESAARNVESGFLEINAPLVAGFEANAAVRYDNYQRSGDTVNPKGSLRWQPYSWVILRGSVGTGFRAPSLTDLYAPQVRGVTGNGTRDPIQCAVFDANNPSCSFQFTTITGGNPNLTPEKSRTFTLGTVLEPVHNLSIDLDSFWIYLRNQIVDGGLNYATILQNAQTATQFASLITRDPTTGQIVAISQTNANLFRSIVSGLDMDLKYGFQTGDVGRLTLLGNGTYFYKYDAQNADGSWSGQLDRGLNVVSVGGIISRFRYNATALYELDSWSASVTQNFQKGYLDVASSITKVPRRVSPYDTIDTQVSYLGLKSFKLTLGAINLFDKAPPYANYAASTNNFIGGYDISYGDPRGRFVYVNGTYSLH